MSPICGLINNPCSFPGWHLNVGPYHVCKTSEKVRNSSSKITEKQLQTDSPNLFGELQWAHRKVWVKISEKYGKSEMGRPFGESSTTFGEQGLTRRKLQCKKGTRVKTKGDQKDFRRVAECLWRPQTSCRKLQNPTTHLARNKWRDGELRRTSE
uniref:Uncharacterized protein n=1 Tax=Solanum tuberosum TaxID=4113 RepID=M1DYI5_SOLTU